MPFLQRSRRETAEMIDAEADAISANWASRLMPKRVEGKMTQQRRAGAAVGPDPSRLGANPASSSALIIHSYGDECRFRA